MSLDLGLRHLQGRSLLRDLYEFDNRFYFNCTFRKLHQGVQKFQTLAREILNKNKKFLVDYSRERPKHLYAGVIAVHGGYLYTVFHELASGERFTSLNSVC